MTRLLVLLLLVSPAMAGECLVNCSVVHRRPLEARELCFAQQVALRQVVEAQNLGDHLAPGGTGGGPASSC